MSVSIYKDSEDETWVINEFMGYIEVSLSPNVKISPHGGCFIVGTTTFYPQCNILQNSHQRKAYWEYGL